ncbi:MAG: hypothetical protein BJ554DRAFT_4723 [Olpidium bornovanus]|uniref:Uncharacterized protein n=1 Tax=Olpidium bornovanus TaxID=278681 RepID=A0A8H8DF14_9FUNG|nr:MAG: hypothetical protein BJ554DRAFT_4723 [Olpidium bornovanus]
MASAPTKIGAADMEAALREKVGASHVLVEDTSGGCGQSFNVTWCPRRSRGKGCCNGTDSSTTL